MAELELKAKFALNSKSALQGQQRNLRLCPDTMVFQSMHASITRLITQFIFWSQISSSPTLNFSSRHSKFVFVRRRILRYQHGCLLTLPSTHMHLDLQKTPLFFALSSHIPSFFTIKIKYALYETCKNIQQKLATLGQDVYTFPSKDYLKICLGSHRGW